MAGKGWGRPDYVAAAIMLSCLVGVAVGPVKSTCSPRIVGGYEAGKVPSLVSIQRFGRHRCQGILVDDQHVYCNAQCLDGVNPKTLKVVLGRTKLSEAGGVTRGVKDFRKHTKWDPRRWEHDEAMLKMDEPVEFSEDIQPACFADDGSVFPAGTAGTVYAWGNIGTSTTLPHPKPLQGLNVTFNDHDLCERIYGRLFTKAMFCAGNMAGGQDICKGDTGGPLFVRQGDDLIVSATVIRGPRECGEPGKPGVYGRHTKEFMESAIEEMRDPDPECGIRENLPVGRIWNGQVAAPHSHPWMAAFPIKSDNITWWYGAVLINQYFVATAKWISPGDEVLLGAYNVSDTSEPGVQRFKVKEVFRHPNYTTGPGNNIRNRILLLKLDRRVRFTKHVQPICLPEAGDFPAAGTTCTFTGRGMTTLYDPLFYNDLLHETSLTTITNDQCRREIYPLFTKWVHNTTFCTAGSKSHPWIGDNGGPLVCQKDEVCTLYGLLILDGDDRYPSLYTNVTAVVPWVKEVLAADDASRGVCFKRFDGKAPAAMKMPSIRSNCPDPSRLSAPVVFLWLVVTFLLLTQPA